jgi:ACR3 family arsenite transporter
LRRAGIEPFAWVVNQSFATDGVRDPALRERGAREDRYLMKVDFGAIRDIGRRPRGLFVTLFVNWLVKPFSMAVFAWLFFRYVFAAWIPPADADQYIAGRIILAAAPSTAMVFVWSYLSDGDPAYTLVPVSVNDLVMLVLFAPIVRFLVSGASSLHVPFQVLLYSVVVFIVIP